MKYEANDGAPRASLHVRLLGGFAVLVAERPVPPGAWRQRRAAAIVKLLALEPTHRLHREQLMEALWPDLSIDAQANNLRQIVHHARNYLEAAGMPRGTALGRDGDMVSLAPAETISVDVQAFERAVADAWRDFSLVNARAALGLYTGDLLPDDPYEEWATPRRIALRASYQALVARVGHYHVERGESNQAIAVFQTLVAMEPTQEAAHSTLMRLYADIGQYELALAQYDHLVATLGREVGVEPTRETQQLARAIRADEYPTAHFPHPSERAAPPQPPAPDVVNLPLPISTFIGRDREIAEVVQILATRRLVTLTGPGGIGKTRLAIAVTQHMVDRLPVTVAFIDLAPLRDHALVIPTIAQALEVRETSTRPLLASLIAALQTSDRLLILDNFEQVIGAAVLLAELLARVPRLRMLVTSRMPLGLRGERQYAVPPLATPESEQAADHETLTQYSATALFVERASEVRHDFVTTAAEAQAVGVMCRRLDGLPLAIELAAALTTIFPPRALLARLDRRLTLLTGGARDLPVRQRTLRNTISWSYDLLTPDEQHLFRQLAAFVGGSTLHATEAVASLRGGALADPTVLLASLIDKNLVTRREGPEGDLRFGMLETIREFGLECLARSGDELAVRDRHAAYFVALAQQAEPHLELADQVLWLGRLDRDAENIRAALTWLRDRREAEAGLRLTKALKLYWFMRGQMTEGYSQLMAFAELPESGTYPLLTSDALNVAGFLMRETADYERAYTASRASLALSHRLGDRQRAADALANLGYIALQQGKHDDAHDLFQRSLTTNRDLDNRQGIADALSFLALTALYRGDLASARLLNEESLAIWIALDDQQATVWARTRLGVVLLKQNAHVEAHREFMASLLTCKDLDFRFGVSWVCDGLAQFAIAHSAPLLALRLAATAAAIREREGINLSPTEQAETDRLLDHLRLAVGGEAVAAAWGQRQGWTLDAIFQAAEDTLHLIHVDG